MQRVLILSSDPLSDNLAGPGIRATEMARELAHSCHVTLAAPHQAHITLPGVASVAFQRSDQPAIEALARNHDIIVLQGFTLRLHPFLATMDTIIVVDLYDPFHLEALEYSKHQSIADSQAMQSHCLTTIHQLLQVGDFFLCASERQRDMWLGALGSVGRLMPETYAPDPTFRSLIDVVPFGLDARPPEHQHPVLKGIVPGIGPHDRVVLWGGGLWDWLDPLTVIRAMALVRQQCPDVRLFFMGHRHPNTIEIPPMVMDKQAVQLVEELGLHETVIFNDRWIPYRERANYLLEADIGVSASVKHIETRFAFRTRLLDYIWAGLPMVVSSGDVLAETVARHHLGHVVPPGESQPFAEALLALLAQPRTAYAPAFAAVREQSTWPQVLKPLVEFCQHPAPAADRYQRTCVDPHEQRVQELEAIIATKNGHIAHLEDLLKRIESGRVMQLFRRIEEWRRGS